jgi:hypothetical protein
MGPREAQSVQGLPVLREGRSSIDLAGRHSIPLVQTRSRWTNRIGSVIRMQRLNPIRIALYNASLDPWVPLGGGPSNDAYETTTHGRAAR